MSHGSLTVPPTKPLVDFMTGPATRVVLMSKKRMHIDFIPMVTAGHLKQVLKIQIIHLQSSGETQYEKN